MSAEPSNHDHDPAAARTGEADNAGTPDLASLDETQIRQLVAGLQDENEKLRANAEAEHDQFLRARAELENFRRRTEREKADTAKYAITKFAADIVAVADNFERAIKAVPDSATRDDPTLKALLEGVEMTEREFLSALERHGVRRVTPIDAPFNPHLHQAVMEVENPDVPTGTCVQVFQHGYTIEDRVLRPAMVSVSRGGPKPAKPAEAAPGEPDSVDPAAEGAPPAGDAGEGGGPSTA